MLDLRIASSQTENAAKRSRVRWSRLVLAAIGCVASVGVALSARRVLCQPRKPLAFTDRESRGRTTSRELRRGVRRA